MKNLFLFFSFFIFFSVQAQERGGAQMFWTNLKAHCGKAFEGTLAPHITNDNFSGKKLVMHVRTCDDDTITIPFFVGEDRSRTWVLTLEEDKMKLKHDHRHEDGSEDRITQYGGTAPNPGRADLQFFPADDETADLIVHAATNVWWITLDQTSFTYNLKRIGSDNPSFTVTFDLTNPVEAPAAPWGWE